jgi:DNA-binding GntR family transcriptional regulator
MTGNQPPTRAADLQAKLADAIVNGIYLPGAKLDEQELADRYGVSRTPVREALKHLAVTGLIALRPHRGAVVATITSQDLHHMFETMAELEALCTGLAAQRMDTVAKRRLRALHESAAPLVAAEDLIAYTEHNLLFHNAIYQGSGNPYIAELTLSIRMRLAPFRGAQFRIPERISRSQSEHRIVFDAILDGDHEVAADAMRQHLLTVGEAAMRYANGRRTAAPGAIG